MCVCIRVYTQREITVMFCCHTTRARAHTHTSCHVTYNHPFISCNTRRGEELDCPWRLSLSLSLILSLSRARARALSLSLSIACIMLSISSFRVAMASEASPILQFKAAFASGCSTWSCVDREGGRGVWDGKGCVRIRIVCVRATASRE